MEVKPGAPYNAPMPFPDWPAAILTHPAALVGAGSAVGGNLRYWLGRWIDARTPPGGMPWGTVAVNVSGSLVLGFLAVALLERAGPARREWYLLLGTGLCGGYTTFSTFELETLRLLRDGRSGAALANVGLSVVAGLAGVAAGAVLARWGLAR